ncbi:MAG: HesA/MoeB/ThiF family protein [Nitrososphaerota archaeon]
MVNLTEKELERYDRQIRIKGIGVDGQLKIKNSRVAVIGIGGLGGISSMYLVAAGVGFVKIIDFGRVELSNLNRQLLYSEEDVGRLKVEVAARKLESLNSDVTIEAVNEYVSEDNIGRLIGDVDVVVDGMDNFKTRFIINDKCVELGIPFIHGAVYSFEGRLMTIIPGETPCLRCLIPEPPPEHEIVPVIGPAPGVIGSLEALEAIKVILKIGESLKNKLLVFDGLNLEFHTIPIEKSPNCPTCSKIK